MSEAEPREPQPPGMIDGAFRNGSITAIGVVFGFSLNFLNQWAANPIQWSPYDFLSATPLVAGIGAQALAFAALLATDSLEKRKYDRARSLFLTGLALVALGVATALTLDIFGLGPRPMFSK